MKINWNERDKTKAIYSIIVVFVSIMFYFFIYRFDGLKNNIGGILSIFYPFVIGGVIAFLLNMPLSYLEKKLNKLKFFEKLKDNNKRKVSMILTYILFVLFIILFFSLLIPQLYESIKMLIDNASSLFTNENYDKLEKIFLNFKIDPRIIDFLNTKIKGIVDYVTEFMKGVLPFIGNIATGVITTTVNWLIGFVISIYLLLDKERFGAMSRKVIYSFLPVKLAENFERITQKINATMKGYIGGQIIVVSILGVMVAASLTFLGVKGAIAMGFIIAVTDLIPIVGPWIGSAPVFLMIVVQDYKKALIFILIILIAQQLEENLIKPRIQGEKLGISSFWVLVSIIVGGSLFGIVGMIIGTPVFVVIYQLIKEISEYLLKRKGLPVKTSEYSTSLEKSEKDKILNIDDEN